MVISYNDSNRTDTSIEFYINETSVLCNLIGGTSFNLISHPIALLIVITCSFLVWRKSFCVSYCFGRPAFPMIIPPYKKHDRFNSALVYGLIATNIIKMFLDFITRNTNSDRFSSTVKDPTGLLSLFVQIFDILIMALKYLSLIHI